MNRTSRAIKILLAIAAGFTTANAAAEGDHKADASTFAKSCKYIHIEIDPVWAKVGDLVQPRGFLR